MGLAVRAFALIYSRTPPSPPSGHANKTHNRTSSARRTAARHTFSAAPRAASSASSSKSCCYSPSRRRSPPSTSHLWRRPSPPQHPARHARAEALARLALSSRQEARVPHPMARRRPRWRARACAPTLGSERAREPPSGDVEQPADRAEKLVVAGRWVDDDDACVAAPPRQLWRPRWAAPRR